MSYTCLTVGRSDLVATNIHGMTSDTDASTALCVGEREREGGEGEKTLIVVANNNVRDKPTHIKVGC